jgi:hypothetical protein
LKKLANWKWRTSFYHFISLIIRIQNTENPAYAHA